MPWQNQQLDKEDIPLAEPPFQNIPQNAGRRGRVLAKQRVRKEKTFICSWAECRRAFGKLEHLQRHERSRRLDQCLQYPEVTDEDIQMLAMFDTSVRYVRNDSSEGEYQSRCATTVFLKYIVSDVMIRHTAIHDQTSIAVKKPKKISWYSAPSIPQMD